MYFQCCNSTHAPILLPDGAAVTIGRSAATKIADKLCSRNQLQVVANYAKKYAMVKRLGNNLSQIDGIDIGYRNTDKLQVDQILYIVNMKYPHKIVWTGEDSVSGATKSYKEVHSSNQRNFTNNKRLKVDSGESNSDVSEAKTSTKSSGPTEAKKPKSGTVHKTSHWSQGLKSSMEDPDLVVFKDEQVVVIKDKYPKARYHWLVMPNEGITTTTQLRSSHLSLLKHLLEVGRKIVEQNVDERDGAKTEFRYGYHAVHSMSHLHMHVISQDFDSPSLKTKKHWNSFTTEYFVDADVIIGEIEADGKVKNRRHMTELLKEPLRCHICKKTQKNIPELKKHVVACR